jgi:hypothetical protein
MNKEIRALLERCFPENVVGTAIPSPSSLSGRSDSWVVLSLYYRHLSCLFPQHGRGRKHERDIVLEAWQLRLVEAAPWSFLRGLVRTDGCHYINRTVPYEYLSYAFSNRSSGILDLFSAACDLSACSIGGMEPKSVSTVARALH